MTSKSTSYYLNVHQELIDQCQVHNQEAQNKIYRLYYKAMYNSSLRIVKDAHTAEDIMQEAFIKAFKKIYLYNNKSSFGAWLKRIVINESINHYRKHNREFYASEFNTSEAHLVEKLPEKQWNDEDFNLVKSAMDLLNDRYRTIISLILLEGYDLEECSEIMGITYGNSRVLFMRAKNKLKNLVDQLNERG